MYKTSDLSLATTLLCYGCTLSKTDNTDPKKVLFTFTSTFPIKDVVDAYFAKQTSVEPSYYFSQIKFLKAQIYANN